MTYKRKGIVLAGGTGSRLYPLTSGISKQLVPIYDKPMIYYPISTLMLSGIRDILIITSPRDRDSFENLLGDGSRWGLSFRYEIQQEPRGLAEAFLIGEDFLGNSDVALILGDNLFHGNELIPQLKNAKKHKEGGTVFAYPVSDPENYGVIEFNSQGKALKIEEKPDKPSSRYAVTGLYFYDNTVVERSKNVVPSIRGELEITSINQMYLKEGLLKVEHMSRGMAWLDTGTFDSLHEAGSYIRTLERRQGLKVGCPEEVAWRQGWINNIQLESLAESLISSGYGKYLKQLLSESTGENHLLQRNLKMNEEANND